jgi:hypothetical protein
MPRPTATTTDPPDFGPNVLIVDPASAEASTATLGAIYWRHSQASSEFGTDRIAYLFKPGQYNMNVDVGYYQTVHGLGLTPDDVIFNGNVQSLATRTQGLALNSFWRGVENICVKPVNPDVMCWAVSQATYLRRVHVKGKLLLWDYRFNDQGGNFSSGGFMADCAVDDETVSGTQQQFLIRNTNLST